MVGVVTLPDAVCKRIMNWHGAHTVTLCNGTSVKGVYGAQCREVQRKKMNCSALFIAGADVRDVVVGGIAGCNKGKRGVACEKDFGRVWLATHGNSHAVARRW